jgi:hypothetical protein
MAKVIVGVAMSLDGFVADCSGEQSDDPRGSPYVTEGRRYETGRNRWWATISYRPFWNAFAWSKRPTSHTSRFV